MNLVVQLSRGQGQGFCQKASFNFIADGLTGFYYEVAGCVKEFCHWRLVKHRTYDLES